MRAELTRPGGRHMLAERGGYETERISILQRILEHTPATAPLVCFLNAASLQALRAIQQRFTCFEDD